jgi:hypothetical protein
MSLTRRDIRVLWKVKKDTKESLRYLILGVLFNTRYKCRCTYNINKIYEDCVGLFVLTDEDIKLGCDACVLLRTT